MYLVNKCILYGCGQDEMELDRVHEELNTMSESKCCDKVE